MMKFSVEVKIIGSPDDRKWPTLQYLRTPDSLQQILFAGTNMLQPILCWYYSHLPVSMNGGQRSVDREKELAGLPVMRRHDIKQTLHSEYRVSFNRNDGECDSLDESEEEHDANHGPSVSSADVIPSHGPDEPAYWRPSGGIVDAVTAWTGLVRQTVVVYLQKFFHSNYSLDRTWIFHNHH